MLNDLPIRTPGIARPLRRALLLGLLLAVPLAAARRGAREAPAALGRYALSFCPEYVATPAGFLSYARWDAARIEAALGRAEVPVAAAFGGEDRRVGGDWRARLRGRGPRSA